MAFSEGDSLLFKNVFAFSFAHGFLFLDILVFPQPLKAEKAYPRGHFSKNHYRKK